MEFIFDVDGNVHKIFVAVELSVHARVHERGIEAEAYDGHRELGHEAAGETSPVFCAEIVVAGEVQFIDVKTSLDTETHLSLRGHAAHESGHNCDEILFHSL